MTSERKQKANRDNARSSTGPKTAKGKARSAKNALRHGLNTPVLRDPALAKEIERMAERIAGEDASSQLLARARAIAEAQIDLQRVRAYRLRRTEQALARPEAGKPSNLGLGEPPIGLSDIAAAEWRLKCIRCAHRRLMAQVGAALARSQRAPTAEGSAEPNNGGAAGPMLQPPQILEITAAVEKSAMAAEPQPVDHFLELAQELNALDRYERRALSRRKFAMREFDRSRRR